MNAQYYYNICTVLATVMDYICRNGASDIQVPYPVVSNLKRDG